MGTLGWIWLSCLSVFVLFQSRSSSKQKIKTEQIEELANVVSDQVDDVDFNLEELTDEVSQISLTLENKKQTKQTKKTNKKKGV